MANFRRRPAHVREVLRIVKQAEVMHAQGNAGEAIQGLQGGCSIVRAVLVAAPGDRDSARQLGAMLYTLAQWQNEAGEPLEGADSLAEAEDAYTRAGPEYAGALADVLVRRATFYLRVSWPLSALGYAQQAIAVAAGWWVRDPEARALDTARVVAVAGYVRLDGGGDPDQADAEAAGAMIEYERVMAARGTGGIPADHRFAIRCAAQVRAVMETVRSRPQADRYRTFAAGLDGGVWPEFPAMADRVRTAQPTLAEALHQAGQDDLAVRLTPNATTATLAGTVRLDPRALLTSFPDPDHPARLVSAADDDSLPMRSRLILLTEAHSRYATWLRDDVRPLMWDFHQQGSSWAGAVLAAGRLLAALEEEGAAWDAVALLEGLRGRLMAQAFFDPKARETVINTIRWSLDMIAADPSTASAADGLRAQLQVLTALH